MDLQKIIQILGDYGTPIVLSGVVIYTIISLINIGIKWANERLLKPPEAKPAVDIEKTNKLALRVEYVLEEALIKCGGERVSVMEFHNGGVNLANVPFTFMSCTYEAYKEGLLPKANSLKNLSMTLFATFIGNLSTRPYVLLNIEERNSDITQTGYELVRMQDAKLSLCVAIKSLHKKMIGYVTLKKNDDVSQSDIEVVKDLALHLGDLLSNEE